MHTAMSKYSNVEDLNENITISKTLRFSKHVHSRSDVYSIMSC